MTRVEMKGITCCGDCGYYNWKKHKCSRCKSIETNARRSFYDDCPLPDVTEKANGALEKTDTYKNVVLTNADGEELHVLMDTKRYLIYPVRCTLEFYKNIGWVVLGEEVEPIEEV